MPAQEVSTYSPSLNRSTESPATANALRGSSTARALPASRSRWSIVAMPLNVDLLRPNSCWTRATA